MQRKHFLLTLIIYSLAVSSCSNNTGDTPEPPEDTFNYARTNYVLKSGHTEEELEGFFIVKAIISRAISL